MRFKVARLMLGTHLPFVMLFWLAAMGVVIVAAAGVALVGRVTQSAIDPSGSILRWFAFGYGCYLTYTLLPTLVMHGQTRRASLAQLSVFAVITTAVLGGLMTAGYALEGVIYRALDWPHRISDDRIFGAPDQYAHIFVSFWGLFLVWGTAGAMIAAGFYRDNGVGLLLIPVGIALVIGAGFGIGFNQLPFLARVLGTADMPLLAAIGLCVLSFFIGSALTWALARDIAVRTRPG